MTLHTFRALAVASVLAFVPLNGCRPSAAKTRPVHALPVSLRAAQPVGSNAGAAHAPTFDSASLAIVHISALPLYKQAQQACAAKQYSHAANLLLKLSHTPGLSPEETAFCFTLVNVCRKDAGLPPVRDRNSERNGHAPLPNTQRPFRYAFGAGSTPNTASEADCGPRALAIVCAQLGVKTDLAALRTAAGTTKDGTTMEGLAEAAKSLGLKIDGIQAGREALSHTQMPAIAWYRGNHFVAVLELESGPGDEGTARIHDPNETTETTISQEILLRRSSGYFLLVHH